MSREKKGIHAVPAVTETSSFTVAEFSSLFGFPASAIIEAIQRNRTTLKKEFYSIPDLAIRWDCSRATVYNILYESEFLVMSFARTGKKRGPKRVPVSTVEKIEQSHLKLFEKTGKEATSSKAA